ncbi:MAG: heme-binding protein [Mobilicoccus sp.]|nr:heme-binding protein [Mobilicoccus sp.]
MGEHVRASASITADGAMAAIRAGWEKSRQIGVAINISVVDGAGNEVAFLRPDGAPLLSMGIARDKAYTVAAFNGVPSHEWFPMIEGEPALREGIVHRDRLVIFGGGVPIMVDGVLVGAVGCSGGSAEQDREVAQAAADAVA